MVYFAYFLLLKVCKICREKFEQFFDEETEEWHLRDSIRVDGRVSICIVDILSAENQKGVNVQSSMFL